MKLKDKLKSHFFKIYKKEEIKDHNLLYLFLELSRKCNLNCLHCGSDCKAENSSAELSTESWIKIIDYFADNYSKELAFIITGGEPLMYKNLDEITSRIKSRNRRWAMVTNGMLLNSDRMKTLEENGIYSLTLSIDGTKNSHNKLRNSQIAFEKLQTALDAVGNSKLTYKDAVTCVFPDNLYELDEIAEILISKKFNSWRLFRIFPSGRAFENKDLQLTFEQTQIMINWIKNNKSKLEKRGLTVNLSCEGWLPFDTDSKVRDGYFFCRAGINIASILSDGNITGCSNNHESFYQGNILKDNFSNIWENKFEDLRERKWLDKTVCNSCEYIKKCKGSSIHLWKKGNEKPNFCYVIEDLESLKL